MPARHRNTDETPETTTETQTSADGTTTPTPDGNPNLEGTPAAAQPGDVTGLTAETQTTPDTGLSADFLSAPVVLDMTNAADYVKASAPQRARSPRQQAMDKTVTELHERWQTAGRPSVWGAIVAAKVVATYFVEPSQVAALKKHVNRAKLLLDLRIKWGSEFVATPDMIARFSLPAEYEGRTVVSFAAMDKRPRAATVTTETAQTNGADDDDDDDDDDDE